MSITAQAFEALPADPAAHAACAASTARAMVDAGLDQLVAADWDSAVDPLELAAWARAVEARVTAVRLGALAEAERRGSARRGGSLSTAAWLKGTGLGAGAAHREVRLAGALADPEHAGTKERLAAGRLGPEQALVVTEAKAALSDAVAPEDRAEFEERLLEAAESMDPFRLRDTAKRLAARMDPSGSGDLERQERLTRSRRELTIAKNRYGSYTLAGTLDPEGAAIVSAALDPLAAPRPSSVDGPDPRTPARRRGDAFVELARRLLAGQGLPTSGGLQPDVVVTMTLDQLRGELDAVTARDGAAQIAGGPVREPLSGARARRLACDAKIVPAVLGGPSEILDFGQSQRTATRGQRRALALRDGGCTAPGCDVPPSWCEAHHLVPWALVQETTLDCLALVCDAHHDLAHHDGWTLRLVDQQVVWIGPDEPPPDPPDDMGRR